MSALAAASTAAPLRRATRAPLSPRARRAPLQRSHLLPRPRVRVQLVRWVCVASRAGMYMFNPHTPPCCWACWCLLAASLLQRPRSMLATARHIATSIIVSNRPGSAGQRLIGASATPPAAAAPAAVDAADPAVLVDAAAAAAAAALTAQSSASTRCAAATAADDRPNQLLQHRLLHVDERCLHFV